MSTRRYNWKKILARTAWVLAGAGTIVLFGAAMYKKNQKTCTDIRIEITGAEKHMFIDEKDVQDMLNAAGRVDGAELSSLNLRAMEMMVERNLWVKNAEMFVDNQRILQVRIEERQPVARVFTVGGNSFYVDSNALRLPLSEKISARVPAFTGFPSDNPVLAKPDSALLRGIVTLGKFILADSFWMAQTAQLDITPQSTFEMIPVLGDHIVSLGNADNLDSKFRRLYTFYRKAWLQNGINTYERLDVQYNNQVVAVRKGTARALVDSARAHAIMNGMMPALPGLNDSSHVVPEASISAPVVVRDTAQVKKQRMAAAPSVNKTNSAAVTNNKTAAQPLSKGKKPVATVQKEKVVNPAAKKQAKAVMKKS